MALNDRIRVACPDCQDGCVPAPPPNERTRPAVYFRDEWVYRCNTCAGTGRDVQAEAWLAELAVAIEHAAPHIRGVDPRLADDLGTLAKLLLAKEG